MSMRFSVLALIASVGGCDAVDQGAADPPRSASNTGPAQSTLTWNSTNCVLPDSPTPPIGQTAETLRQAFGRPDHDTRFLFIEGLYGPREVILNRLQLKGNERLAIREMMWLKGRCSLIVWLTQRQGRWHAVQTSRSLATADD